MCHRGAHRALCSKLTCPKQLTGKSRKFKNNTNSDHTHRKERSIKSSASKNSCVYNAKHEIELTRSVRRLSRALTSYRTLHRVCCMLAVQMRLRILEVNHMYHTQASGEHHCEHWESTKRASERHTGHDLIDEYSLNRILNSLSLSLSNSPVLSLVPLCSANYEIASGRLLLVSQSSSGRWKFRPADPCK